MKSRKVRHWNENLHRSSHSYEHSYRSRDHIVVDMLVAVGGLGFFHVLYINQMIMLKHVCAPTNSLATHSV